MRMCQESRNIFAPPADLVEILRPRCTATLPDTCHVAGHCGSLQWAAMLIALFLCIATLPTSLDALPEKSPVEPNELAKGIAAVKRNDLTASYVLLERAILSNPD